jgi:hypothetical protein
MCIRNAYVSVAVTVPTVTSRYHGTISEISKVTRNKRRLRHIHVNTVFCNMLKPRIAFNVLLRMYVCMHVYTLLPDYHERLVDRRST